jgi:hypothetical protein
MAVKITSWAVTTSGILTIRVTGPLGMEEVFGHHPGHSVRAWKREINGVVINPETSEQLDALVSVHPILGKIADDILRPSSGHGSIRENL